MSDLLETFVKETIANSPNVSPISERDNDNVGSNETSGQVAIDSETADSSKRDGLDKSGFTGGPPIQLPPATSVVGIQTQPEILDPELHILDEHGQPKLNKDGSYAKKRGRKKGQTNNHNHTENTGGIPNTDQLKIQTAHAAAVTTVQIIFIMGRMIGGEEFVPIVDASKGINEPQLLTDAWTQYYLTTDIEYIPPWIGVVIATGSFFAGRVTLPTTSGKLKTFWVWCKSWFTTEEKKKEKESE